jgi:putative tryptophan/tyrosine transport system substrate-binding protein
VIALLIQGEGSRMRRREFIGGLGSAAAWPLAARAQQPDKVRRIGVIMGFSVQNSEAKRRVAAFERTLAELGWKDGIDLEIEYRWPGNPPDRLRADIAEIVNLNPDAILVTNEPTLSFTSVATSTIPIVFVNVTYAGLARHYDNVTGIIAIEPQVAEKWVLVLKDLVPGIERVGFFHAPPSAPEEFLRSVEAAAASHGLKIVSAAMSRPGGPVLETTIAEFAAEPNGGLVVMPSFITATLRPRIIRAAAQNRVPAIYGHRFFTAEGGLISYGPDIAQSFAQAASYIDRILKGETPAGLPLQPPSRYDLVINLKTAKTLGLTIPETLLATADEVIQ